MKVTYFGHSAVGFESGGYAVLIDPFITDNPWTEGIVTADGLDADTILLTHAHGDHWGDTPAIAKRTGAEVVATFEIIQYLSRNHGHENGIAANTGGKIVLDWGSVSFTHARHSSSFPDGTYGGSPNGFIIEAGGVTLYHAGDTAPFPDMEWLGSRYDIDLAFIPIGDCFTMGPEDSLRAIELVRPRAVVPIHYDTFPPIKISNDRLEAWSAAVRELGAKPEIMGCGETLELT